MSPQPSSAPQPSPPAQPAQPQQARSLATMNRILDSASTLLTEGGWDAFTTNEIASRAGVSVGVIYQRFGDKNGLFAAVHEAHITRLEARAASEFAPRTSPTDRDAREVVHDVISRLGAIFEEFGALNGALLTHSNRIPGLGQRGAVAMVVLRRHVTDLLRTCSDEIAHPEPEVVIAVCFRLAFSTFMDFATFCRLPNQQHEMSWGRLISEVAEACTAYLLTPRNRPAPSETASDTPDQR